MDTGRFDVIAINPVIAVRELERQYKRIAELEAERRWIKIRTNGVVTTNLPQNGQHIWLLRNGIISDWYHVNAMLDAFCIHDYWRPAELPEVE